MKTVRSLRSEAIKSAFNLALCTVLFVFCVSVHAQQPTKIPRIGYLSPNSPPTNPARIEAFRHGLRELGYTEGKNIFINIGMRRTNSTACPRWRPNSLVSRETSSSRVVPHPPEQLRKQLLRYPLSLRRTGILSPAGSLPALGGQEGTLPDCPPYPRSEVENDWSC